MYDDPKKQEVAHRISQEYIRRRYQQPTLRLIRIAKGMALLKLGTTNLHREPVDYVRLPSWTDSKEGYVPWKRAEGLLLPEYNIRFRDERYIQDIRTDKNIVILHWRERHFKPIFRDFLPNWVLMIKPLQSGLHYFFGSISYVPPKNGTVVKIIGLVRISKKG